MFRALGRIRAHERIVHPKLVKDIRLEIIFQRHPADLLYNETEDIDPGPVKPLGPRLEQNRLLVNALSLLGKDPGQPSCGEVFCEFRVPPIVAQARGMASELADGRLTRGRCSLWFPILREWG